MIPTSLAANPNLDRWVRFDRDGKVLGLITGKRDASDRGVMENPPGDSATP